MEKYKKQLEMAVSFAVDSKFENYLYCQYVQKRKREAKEICLYGTGHFFNDYVQHIDKFDYVCDSSPEKWGKIFGGKKCISPQELAKKRDAVVFIMLGNYKEVREKLTAEGIENYYFGDLYLNVYDSYYTSEWFELNRSKIIDAVDFFEDDWSKKIYVNAICNRIAPQYSELTFHDMEEKGEYFETGILKFEEEECFVDGGAYNGDSIENFIHAVQGKFKAIYGFELDSTNYKALRERKLIVEDTRIQLFQKGIADENCMVDVACDGTGSHIVENGLKKAELVRLDDLLEGEKITFIKMDIEGAEVSALKGSEKILKSQYPKLAISVYHKLNDMWEIPAFIKYINPNYKVYLRHHTAVAWDTDCYAYLER